MLALVIAVPAAATGQAAREMKSESAERVLVVLADSFQADQIAPSTMPELSEVMGGEVAIGVVATRSTTNNPDTTDIAVSISAGARATGKANSAQAFAGTEVLPDGPDIGSQASDVVTRRTGRPPRRQVVIPNWYEIIASNEKLRFGAIPGILGDTLTKAGWSTGAIVTGDTRREESPVLRRSHAALVADQYGELDELHVGFTRGVTDAPEGELTDTDAVLAQIASAPAHSLTVLATSDLQRVTAMRSSARRSVAAKWELEAQKNTDHLLASIMKRRAANDVVILLLPIQKDSETGLAFIAVAGPGIPSGFVQSPTTDRAGTIRIQDLGASITHFVGIPIPEDMEGRSLRVSATELSGSERLRSMRELIERSWLRTETAGQFPVVLSVVLLLVLGTLLIPNLRGAPQWIQSLLLAVAPCMLLASYVINVIHTPTLLSWYLSLVLTTLVLLMLMVLMLREPERVLLGCWIALVLMIVVDISVAGNAFQFNGPLGFGPVSNSRFSGIGNAGYALLGTAALGIGHWFVTRFRFGWWYAAALLALVIVIDAAPFLGEDFGGLITLTPAAGVALIGWRSKLPRKKTILIGVGGAIGVIILAILIEIGRPVESRSHLGRFIEAISQNPARAWEVVQRKLDLNLVASDSSAFRFSAIAALVMVWYLFRADRLKHWNTYSRTAKVSIAAFGVLAIAGTILNDSGLDIAGMMMLIVVPYAIALQLRHERANLSA